MECEYSPALGLGYQTRWCVGLIGCYMVATELGHPLGELQLVVVICVVFVRQNLWLAPNSQSIKEATDHQCKHSYLSYNKLHPTTRIKIYLWVLAIVASIEI
jgi:hypothetical protein